MKCAPIVALTSLCAACDGIPRTRNGDWAVTGADAGNTRYSSLDQINRGNVSRLRIAWTFHTGDVPAGARSEIQATPIVVDGVLYTTTPVLAVIALRADSGTLIWRFDPFAGRTRESHVNRGVAFWADDRDQRILLLRRPASLCARRELRASGSHVRRLGVR